MPGFGLHATPRVEAVSNDHPISQHLVIIGEIARQPVRDGEQALALRREAGSGRVGPPHDGRQAVEGRILDVVGLHDRIERTAVTTGAELDSLAVVWRASTLLRANLDRFRWNVDDFLERIDEAADQPWARDAIDLGMFARDPLVRASPGLPARGQAVLLPTCDAAFDIGGLEAGPSQGCRHALADLVAMHAVRN